MTSPYHKKHIAYREKVRVFLKQNVIPDIIQMELKGETPMSLIRKISNAGYLSTHIPRNYGGRPVDAIMFGILNQEFGAINSGLRSLITVNSMVCHAIANWGTDEQKNKWLTEIAKEKLTGAFALSEPNVGSDATSITCEASDVANGLLLNGVKTWITYGQVADLFLVFVKYKQSTLAIVVERNTPGLIIKKLEDLEVENTAMHSELRFDNCIISKANILGPDRDAVQLIAMNCLSIGRLSIAWSGLGIAKSSLSIARDHIKQRRQFNVLLKDHQLVQKIVTDMILNVEAGENLCISAAQHYDQRNPQALFKICIAKHYIATSTGKIVSDAIQLLGAAGLTKKFPLVRYLKEVKVMEIIEGSNQMHELLINQLYQ